MSGAKTIAVIFGLYSSMITYSAKQEDWNGANYNLTGMSANILYEEGEVVRMVFTELDFQRTLTQGATYVLTAEQIEKRLIGDEVVPHLCTGEFRRHSSYNVFWPWSSKDDDENETTLDLREMENKTCTPISLQEQEDWYSRYFVKRDFGERVQEIAPISFAEDRPAFLQINYRMEQN